MLYFVSMTNFCSNSKKIHDLRGIVLWVTAVEETPVTTVTGHWTMNGDSFFRQLKQLCRVVEQGLQEVSDEVDNNRSKRGPAGAQKKIMDLKSDVEEMQVINTLMIMY